MEGQFKHLYQLTVDELEQLLWEVNFTSRYYADCYYGAYTLGVNPHEALWYINGFVEWVDENIDAGEFVTDAEGVWDWMRKVTAHDVAEELYNFTNCWDIEGHMIVLETIKVTPVIDYFYPWGEDRFWREILKCWKINGQKKQDYGKETD